MKKTIHYHLTIRGQNVLCAVDYENEINQYDVTIWCNNRMVGREKMKTVNRPLLSRIVKERLHPGTNTRVKKSTTTA